MCVGGGGARGGGGTDIEKVGNRNLDQILW